MSINGQWEGELRGKVGHFPFTHVEFIDEDGGTNTTTNTASWFVFFTGKKIRKKVKFATTTTTKKCKQEIYIYQIQNLYTQLKMLCKQTADQMCAKKTWKERII